MAIDAPRPNEPLIDPKTGVATKRFLGIINEINALLNGLSFSDVQGLVSVAQLPSHSSTHPLDALGAPSDVTTLNATALAHGLLPKLSGNAAHRLNGVGAWV